MRRARRWSLLLVLAPAVFGVLVVGPGSLAAQAPQPPVSQIVASGVGEVTVVPDRGTIYLAVETRSATAAAAGSENARTQTAVISALRAKGVLPEHLTTTGYSVGPNERYDNGQRKVIGYIARNTVVVDVQKLEQTGALIDAALAAGANSVGGLRYYSTKFETVRRTALEQAVARAKADAEVMARAAGGSLGAPIEISVNDAGFQRMALQNVVVTGAAYAAGAPETPVVTGEQKVTVSISSRWTFIPGR